MEQGIPYDDRLYAGRNGKAYAPPANSSLYSPRGLVGWVERSETHHEPFPAARPVMGFAALYPSYAER